MFTLRRLILGERLRLFMMAVFFVVFVVFSTQFILDQENLTNVILAILFLSFMSFFFLLSEILRFFYRLSTKALIVDCNPKLAEKYIKKVKQFDVIKGYKNDLNEATSYFKIIQEAYSKNIKKRKSPKTVYSLNAIVADYYIMKGNINKAEQNLKAINENYLNLREKTYYYIAYAKFYKLKNNPQKEEQYVALAKDITDHLYHVNQYN